MDYRLRRHDGEYRWVFDRSRPVEIDGKFVGFIGFAVDVTERRDLDASRRDMEEQVRLLTLATRDLVWSWDARTGRVIHNKAFSEILGDAPGPLNATLEWWKQRVHSEDRERATGAFDKAMRDEASDVSSEYRIRRRNGTWISVDDRACIVRDADGRVLRVLGAMRDIFLTQSRGAGARTLRANPGSDDRRGGDGAPERRNPPPQRRRQEIARLAAHGTADRV